MRQRLTKIYQCAVKSQVWSDVMSRQMFLKPTEYHFADLNKIHPQDVVAVDIVA